jgi:hypothetical protein
VEESESGALSVDIDRPRLAAKAVRRTSKFGRNA